MKVEFIPNKIIIYLYQYSLNFDNIDDVNKKIKEIFIMLMQKYKLNFFGYSKVSIYHNNNYGSIIEIERIYDNCEFNITTIDLRIILYKDIPMFLEFNNFYFNQVPNKLIIKNNKYYLDIDDIDNIIEYIEYGKIVYKNN